MEASSKSSEPLRTVSSRTRELATVPVRGAPTGAASNFALLTPPPRNPKSPASPAPIARAEPVFVAAGCADEPMSTGPSARAAATRVLKPHHPAKYAPAKRSDVTSARKGNGPETAPKPRWTPPATIRRQHSPASRHRQQPEADCQHQCTRRTPGEHRTPAARQAHIR